MKISGFIKYKDSKKKPSKLLIRIPSFRKVPLMKQSQMIFCPLCYSFCVPMHLNDLLHIYHLFFQGFSFFFFLNLRLQFNCIVFLFFQDYCVTETCGQLQSCLLINKQSLPAVADQQQWHTALTEGNLTHFQFSFHLCPLPLTSAETLSLQ